MPDLTIENYYYCDSAEWWRIEVEGSNEQTYEVKYDQFSHLRHQEVQFDYSCTCWAYKKGKGKHCKHIERVKDQHCGWLQFVDGGDLVDGACPKCGGMVSVHRIGNLVFWIFPWILAIGNLAAGLKLLGWTL